MEAANLEMAGFALEIAAGVTSARLAEIDSRKALLNENIPSFKVTHSPFTSKLPYTISQREGEILFFLLIHLLNTISYKVPLIFLTIDFT